MQSLITALGRQKRRKPRWARIHQTRQMKTASRSNGDRPEGIISVREAEARTSSTAGKTVKTQFRQRVHEVNKIFEQTEATRCLYFLQLFTVLYQLLELQTEQLKHI